MTDDPISYAALFVLVLMIIFGVCYMFCKLIDCCKGKKSLSKVVPEVNVISSKDQFRLKQEKDKEFP